MPSENFALSWDGRLMEPRPADELARFRALALDGKVEELSITFHPTILGGPSAPPITGFGDNFLPRGIVLEFVRMKRLGEQCVATYRISRKKATDCTPATPS